ncbi:MAG: transcriptional regulator [Clostridiales bacterium]|jgi:TfoX/Sxy family transcriptional regulator of competence genes|nr:transcriptional regulator [Clostridiales bacterium]
MATTVDFIEFAVGQIEPRFERRYRKMFGDYMVYINEKPILSVCDNTVFVKIVPEIAEQMAAAEKGYPYVGAREHYVLDIKNAEFVNAVVSVLEKVTPLPKPKKRKKVTQ